MKFREHRGGFDESMATVREFDTLEELRLRLIEIYGIPVVSIEFEYYGFDERCEWHTYFVTANFEGITPRCPVGFSDDQFKSL